MEYCISISNKIQSVSKKKTECFSTFAELAVLVLIRCQAINKLYFVRSYSQSFHYQGRTKEKSLSAFQKWCYRLLVRNHLTVRAGTHISKEHSENYKEKMFELIS